MMGKIFNEDCLITMGSMPDKSIDLSLTSPPYNMNLRIRNGKYCSRQVVKEFTTKYQDFNDNIPIDDFYSIHKNILSELLRVSKIVFYNFQVVTGSKRAFFKLIGEFNEEIKEIITWDKVNAQPAMLSGVLNSQSEFILVLEDNAISRKYEKYYFDRGSLSNVWQIKRGKKINKNHGAVFPTELVYKVLQNFTKVGDLIYDPFGGSGTTAEVSELLKRNWIVSEISANYCTDIFNRIEELHFKTSP